VKTIKFFLMGGKVREFENVEVGERNGYWVVERIRELSELVVSSIKDSDIVAIVPNANLLWIDFERDEK